VLLVLRNDISYTRGVHALGVGCLLLVLRLLQFIVECLELVRLFIDAVAGIGGALVCVVVVVLENICLVLGGKSLLCNRNFGAQTVKRPLI